jgi:hypothetical protein
MAKKVFPRGNLPLVIKIMPLGVLEMHLMIFDVITCVTMVVAYAIVGVTRATLTTFVT